MTNVLTRLLHSFHMHEVWTTVQPHYQKFVAKGVAQNICDCALDTEGNGIDQELKNIFFFFRECTGQLVYVKYYEQLLDGCRDKPQSEITSSKSWAEKKKDMVRMMVEDPQKIALFIYCAL